MSLITIRSSHPPNLFICQLGVGCIVWLGPVRNESAGVEGSCQCHAPERDAKPVKPAQDSDQRKISQAESEQERRLEQQLCWLQRKVRVGQAE